MFGVKAITSSAHLRGLLRLDLHGNLLGDAGLQVLARWPGLAQLRELVVRNNKVRDLGAQELAASPHLRRLEVLDLSHNDFGPDADAALEALAAEGRVGKLELAGGPAGLALPPPR